MHQLHSLIVCLCLLVISFGCTGGPEPVTTFARTEFSGAGLLGTGVRGADVHVHKASNGAKAARLDTVVTDDAGHYEVDTVAVQGDLVVCMTDGEFCDAYTAISLPVSGSEVCTYVPDAEQIEVVPIHYLTHQAWCLLRYRGESGAAAWATACRDISAYWGCAFGGDLDIVGVTPIDLEAAGPSSVTAEVVSALVPGTVSTQAALLSEEMGYAAASRITLLSLSDAGCDDLLADGTYNSIGRDGVIDISGYVMQPSTYSDGLLGLAQSSRTYLRSARNLTGLDETAFPDQLACLGVDGGPLTSSAVAGESQLDTTNPRIAPKYIHDGDVVSQTIDVDMLITDAGGIIHASFASPAEITDVRLEYAEDHTGKSDPRNATLTGTLDTLELSDGPLPITAIAHDASGNEGTATTTVIVANSAPQFVEPDDLDTPLRGVVPELRFCASGPELDKIELVSPTGLETRYESDAADSGCLIAAKYDSTEGGVDTPVVFSLRAASRHGLSTPASYTYQRDNFSPGEVRGCVFSDSPVVGATLRPCLRADVEVCTAIANTRATTDEHGCFSMPLPDDVSGLLELRARGGSYIDAHGGHDVELGTFPGYTQTVRYAPTAEGPLLDHRSIHLWTTAADRWARANRDRYDSLEAAYVDSYARHSDHAGVDIATTYARDFVTHSLTSHANRTAEANNRLGLSLRARGFRASMIAVDNEMSADSLTSLDIDTAILTSADSGLHDGFDVTGDPVTIARTTFDANSLLRKGVADAIGVSLQPAHNTSDLTVAMYSQPGGFLEHLATNPDALLFGDLQAAPFDTAPPSIVLAIVDADGNAAETSPLRVDVPVWLRVQLEDPSGFRVLNSLVEPDVELSCLGGAPPSRAIGALDLVSEEPGILVVRYSLRLHPVSGDDDTTSYDGTCTLSVIARDASHNASAPAELDLVVDHTPPRTHIAPSYVHADSNTVATKTFATTWTAVDDLSDVVLVGCDVSHDAGASTQAACASFDPRTVTDDALSVDLGKCDTEALVRLWADDAAGNRAAGQWQPANCDATAPALALATSQYPPADLDDGSFDPITERHTRTVPQEVDFTDSQQEPFVFSVWHDEYFSGSLKAPLLRATVSDHGDGGTKTEQLTLWYEYQLNGELIYTGQEYQANANGEISLRLDPRTLGAETQRSRPDDVHTVTLYVRDLAGNQDSVEFSWSFAWVLPRIHVYDCNKSSQYSNLRLAANDTSPETLYSNQEAPIIEGRLYWAYRDTGTADHVSLHVTLGNDRIRTAVTRLVEDRIDGPLELERRPFYCGGHSGHRFDGDSSCSSGALADETESSIPGPTAQSDLSYTIGAAASQAGTFAVPPDARLDFSARAAMHLNYSNNAVFRSQNRYSGGNERYSILRRDGLDESQQYRICEPEPDLPGGQLCYYVVDHQHWEQYTYVAALSVTAGSLSATAELLIDEGDSGTDPYTAEVRVVLHGTCNESFDHTTSR